MLQEKEESQTCVVHKPDPPPAALHIKHQDPVVDALWQAAPSLLNELAELLSQHKWDVRCLPPGIVNILSWSWQDHTAGPVQQCKPRVSLMVDPAREKSAGSDNREGGQRKKICDGESVCTSVRKPQASSPSPHMGKHKLKSRRAPSSGYVFSISSNSCKDPDWTVQPKQPSFNKPQTIRLCEQMSLQTADQDVNKPLIRRHYNDAKMKVTEKRSAAAPVNWLPHIPKPTLQKLHYRFHDGSSTIYYPSGRMAVCQTHSGLPCGGYHTNVFSDDKLPIILATITVFGHGSVTDPLSSAITAVWDPDGGFLYDLVGNITKEWSWQKACTVREKITIQVSDMILVRLHSGTSAMLSFRCNNESVKLPLLALSIVNQPNEAVCLQTGENSTSCNAEDPLQAEKRKPPAVGHESTTNLTLTPEVLQMVREVEGLEEPSAWWRRGGEGGSNVGTELRRLQLRIQTTLDGWLDFYRLCLGIKCPDMKRVPDSPLRTRLRREEQLAAMSSLNPPERAAAKPVQRLSAERPVDSSITLTSPDLQPSSVACHPAPLSFTPSAPLTVCPALLRAALRGEGGRRQRCYCSAALMPVVTDLEYDVFITGQPPHSHQVLVVCVTAPNQAVNMHTARKQEVLGQLYRRMNRHRDRPCNQCQMDSFRLVRYKMSAGNPSCEEENLLLQRRHNAAPGMFLMYMTGKLLFVGHIRRCCSVRDLENQICLARKGYRLGVSLPPDYKFSDAVNSPAAADANNSQDATLKRGDDIIVSASVDKARRRAKV